jgi:hypothetical protein
MAPRFFSMNSIKILLVGLVIFIQVTFCQGQTEIVAELYKTKYFTVAIFPASYTDMVGSGNKFTPTHAQIDSAEFALRENIKLLSIKAPTIAKRYKYYYRQYFGFIDNEGNKVVLINAIPANKAKDWLKRLISVTDGGSDYWNVKYSFTSRIFSDFNVNGPG